ncbi:alpha/beta hydrolase [Burkholderiaceae bacterium FT117]|uniref:alpha/beta hydrolase n=1 Tax=Zeimonas sediminis TaxID=2944268 RepID=UPI00234321BE|nr:dienelactone hydrolase family protein [Zeimonas sediminis]MCM5569277.1 alpha/beta hydrolase [Zeimonas sediminis]
MSIEVVELQSGSDPGASVIVMHGLGADGNDFVPVCEALDLSAAGPVRFVLPHAPVRPVTINGGYRMRAWYDILNLGADRREDEDGLRESQAIVESLIRNEMARGIDASRIVLMGFSQGCAMALMAGLRFDERLAGIAGLSGYLPLADSLPEECSEANSGLPIFLAHGTHDPIVTIDRAHATREILRALDHPVEWHEYPMEHEVCAEEVGDLNHWLLEVLQ